MESVQWKVFRPNMYGGMGTEQLKELKWQQKKNELLLRAALELTLDKSIPSEAAIGMMAGLGHDPAVHVMPEREEPPCPLRRRACIAHPRSKMKVSERRICRAMV